MSQNRSFLEKRTTSRISVRLPVQFRSINTTPGIEKFRGNVTLAKDLSLGGLFMKVPKEMQLQSGDILRLDISLPETSKHLFAFSEVVWRNQTGAGIRLLQMPVEDQESLKDYLDMKVSA